MLSDWYLLYTKPRSEQVAELNLKRQGYRSYLPFTLERRRHQGTYHLIKTPMFPRYLFIQLNKETDNWSPIRSTKGVTDLVRFGGCPAKVPNDLIETLSQKEISYADD